MKNYKGSIRDKIKFLRAPDKTATKIEIFQIRVFNNKVFLGGPDKRQALRAPDKRH